MIWTRTPDSRPGLDAEWIMTAECRDLFDLWLALTRLAIPPEEILTSFAPYRPEKYTGPLAIANLRLKLQDNLFRRDLDALVAYWPDDYDIDEAGALITRELLSHVD